MSKRIKVCLCFGLLVVLAGASIVKADLIPQPPVNTFDKRLTGSIPDLDQNRDFTGDGVAEQTWCAPTASADCVWYLGGKGYPNLIPAGANNVAKADALISALGGLMGTADPQGTTINNCVNGLQQYLNNAYPNTLQVSLFTAWSVLDNAGQPSAQNLWNIMTNELYLCHDVLPIIKLPQQGNPPIPPTSDNEIMDMNLDSVGGHLVMMTGYNIVNYPGSIDIFDPDDNVPAGVHVFPPPLIAPVTWNLAFVGASPQGTALSINGGAGGLIVGAISVTPEPATMVLLGLGALALIRRQKQ